MATPTIHIVGISWHPFGVLCGLIKICTHSGCIVAQVLPSVRRGRDENGHGPMLEHLFCNVKSYAHGMKRTG